MMLLRMESGFNMKGNCFFAAGGGDVDLCDYYILFVFYLVQAKFQTKISVAGTCYIRGQPSLCWVRCINMRYMYMKSKTIGRPIKTQSHRVLGSLTSRETLTARRWGGLVGNQHEKGADARH